MSICNPRDENHNNQRIVDDFLYGSNYDPNALTIIYDTNDKIESIKITIKGVNYNFELIKKLGEGGFGTVSLFKDNLQKVSFAIKSSDTNDEEEISKALKKNGCAVLKTRFFGKKGIMYHCIMELADGDLLHWGEALINTNPSLINQELFLGIAEEIRRQLLCIFNLDKRNNKFLYYDIKLENILFKCDDQQNLNNYRIMLGDLGSASKLISPAKLADGHIYACTYPAWERRDDPFFKSKQDKLDALSWEIGIILLYLSSFLGKNIAKVKTIQQKFDNILSSRRIKNHTISSIQTLQEELNTAYGPKFMNYLNADPNLRPSILLPLQNVQTIHKLSSPLNTIKLKKLTVVQLKDISKKLNCGPIGKRNKDSLIDFIIDCKRNKPQSIRKPSTPQSIRKPSAPQSIRKPSTPQYNTIKLRKLTVVQLKDISKKLNCGPIGKRNKESLIKFILDCKRNKHPAPIQSVRKSSTPPPPPQTQSIRKVSSQITPSKLNELSLVELKTIAKKVDCKNKQSLIQFIVDCKNK
jgi:serine/threonine protein kinase